MPLTSESLCALRPFAYHTCSAINFRSIRASGSLKSARNLLSGTAHEQLLLGRRLETTRVAISGEYIEVRDHRPLVPGSLALPAGYSINDFVDELNSRVFLWAGTELGPVRSGRNHIARYAAEGKIYVLRVPLTRLLQANPSRSMEVTFCNSGAARHNQGQPAERSSVTFVPLSAALKGPAEVVELTFRNQVALPIETTYSENYAGQWERLR